MVKTPARYTGGGISSYRPASQCILYVQMDELLMNIAFSEANFKREKVCAYIVVDLVDYTAKSVQLIIRHVHRTPYTLYQFCFH